MDELRQSIVELHRKVDAQARILAELAALRANIEFESQSGSRNGHFREDYLEQLIRDAITTLEQSKRSFRSRQLEQLRRRLMQALLDEDCIGQGVAVGKSAVTDRNS